MVRRTSANCSSATLSGILRGVRDETASLQTVPAGATREAIMVFSSSTPVAAETVRQYAVKIFPPCELSNIVKVASIRVAMMSSPPYYLGPAIHAEQQSVTRHVEH